MEQTQKSATHKITDAQWSSHAAQWVNFSVKAINPAGADGLMHGNWQLFQAQCWSVIVAWVWTFVSTYILVKLVDKVLHFTVTESEQEAGLDKFHYGKTSMVYTIEASNEMPKSETIDPKL